MKKKKVSFSEFIQTAPSPHETESKSQFPDRNRARNCESNVINCETDDDDDDYGCLFTEAARKFGSASLQNETATKTTTNKTDNRSNMGGKFLNENSFTTSLDNAGNNSDMNSLDRKNTHPRDNDNHSYSQLFLAPGRSVESNSKPKRFVLPGRRDDVSFQKMLYNTSTPDVNAGSRKRKLFSEGFGPKVLE